MFKIRKTDMDANHATFIVDSANIIRDREASNETSVFLSDLKHILDSRFGGDWNLMTGRSVGYAMKTRKKASFVLTGSNQEVLMGWRSPGFEVEDVDIVKIKAKLVLSEKDTLLEESAIDNSRLKIISTPSPDSDSYSADTPKALRMIASMSDDLKDMEHDTAARHIRNNLTARFGTIWHVAVGGTGEFSMKPAKACTDHIIAATKKGLKIELFRHKAAEPVGISGIQVPSMQTVLDVLPTILFIFLCVGFLVQKSSVCHGDLSSKAVLTKGLCWATTSFSLTPLAVVLFVMTIVKQVRKSIQQKQLKQQRSSRKS